MLQGVSCFIAGLFGTANGTTAYNENIGAMQITGVGSRIVVQTGACIIIVVAIIGALSACLDCGTADILYEHLRWVCSPSYLLQLRLRIIIWSAWRSP